MGLDKALVLTANRKQRKSNDPVSTRRTRLMARISKQVELLEYDKRGEPSTRAHRRLAKWWWEEDGKWFVSIQYCRQPLELAKGKYAIQCADLDGIASAFRAVEKAIVAGSYDQLLMDRSEKARANFKRKKLGTQG
jgi:hypothetical protein